MNKLTKAQIWLGVIVLAFCTTMQLSTLYQTIKDKQEVSASIDEANVTEIPVPIIIIDENSTDVKQEDSNKTFEYFKNVLAKDIEEQEAKDILDSIVTISEKYEIDYRVILALIYTESNFNANIKHKHSKVVGIGGIHTGVWAKPLKEAGIIDRAKDLNDTDKNIEATCFIFKHYLDKSNDNILSALHSYKGRGFDKNLNQRGLSLARDVYSKYLKIKSKM